jgi:quercetin dioxygenase-like cupin family protein
MRLSTPLRESLSPAATKCCWIACVKAYCMSVPTFIFTTPLRTAVWISSSVEPLPGNRAVPEDSSGVQLAVRPRARWELMVKISDKSDYPRFVRPADRDEGIWLDHVEIHLVTHAAGQVKEMHVHDPPQDHVIVMRSGRERWRVEEQIIDAGPGDVIVTLATAHSYEVLGGQPARVVCIDSAPRPKPTS